MRSRKDAFLDTMTSLHDIRTEIERLSEQKRELLHTLGERHDAVLVAERVELEERIAQLWNEYRNERARLLFGERDEIIARARHEERLERAAA
jgi:ABC-type phosphate transport system auxiliary subunit